MRGEVSNLRAQASGHVYFSLKDAGAQLACVLFRGDAARQSVALRDGLQVLATGRSVFTSSAASISSSSACCWRTGWGACSRSSSG